MLTHGSYEGRFFHHLRFVHQCAIIALPANALTGKAEITHWSIDGQSGDDGGSFLQMIRYIARPCPKVAYKRHFYVKI